MEKKIYFSGLDGLRFIAIFFVVVHHFFTFRNYYDTTVVAIPVTGIIGYYGIQFFFAGSGFLITYLLLAEKIKFGKISIRNFYLRRILRIWPAYYVLIIIALVLLPHISFFNIPVVTRGYYDADYRVANLLYFSFLPHFAGIYYPTGPYIHHTYTIGMEEQFYFLWGLLFLFFFNKIKVIFQVILVAIPCLYAINDLFITDNGNWALHKYLVLVDTLKYFRFPTFALGALWALAYFNERKWTKIFNKKWIQLLIYVLIIFSCAFDVRIPFVRDEYISLLMLCLLSCAMAGKESLVNYERPWLRFLGKISYGIYLFHILAIVVSVKVVSAFTTNIASVPAVMLLIICTLGLSVLFGWLSYISIEKFFLSIKKKLKKV
ncbi:MAG: acyltransferase [Niabella sp.]